MEDRQIIDLYWRRSERAISETVVKYGVYLRSIAFWSDMNLCENGVILKTGDFPLDGITDDYENPRTYGLQH